MRSCVRRSVLLRAVPLCHLSLAIGLYNVCFSTTPIDKCVCISKSSVTSCVTSPVHSQGEMSFTTLLHNAAREGNVAEVTRLLSLGASVVIKDKHSRTPLHLAAWAGQLECCKVLVAQGTDKNAAAMDDTTALHFAAQKGHFEVARFLLNEGSSRC